jgi:hypothetical protein
MTEGKDNMEPASKDIPMQTIVVKSLSFTSYSLLCTLISICLGVVGSILFCVVDLLGVNTSVQLGLLHLNDTETGIVFLFIGPFLFGVIGFVGSMLTHRLFLWVLRRFGGFSLSGSWKNIKDLGGANGHHQDANHTPEAHSNRHPH